jgi:hypothetical protein
VYKILTVLLLLFSTAAIAEEKKIEEPTCVPFVFAFNMLREAKYAPFMRKRGDTRVDEIIYSTKTKRVIHIWYFQADKTAMPISLCIGKTYEGFDITSDFMMAIKEFIINPEVPL